MKEYDENHPKEKGEICEAICMAELKKNGFTVLTPFGDNARYDFVVERDNEFVRLQAKRGRYKDGCVIFSVASTGVNYDDVNKETYDGDADYFIVSCPEIEKIYLVPVSETGKRSFQIREDDSGNNQSKRVNWSDDYVLENRLSDLR